MGVTERSFSTWDMPPGNWFLPPIKFLNTFFQHFPFISTFPLNQYLRKTICYPEKYSLFCFLFVATEFQIFVGEIIFFKNFECTNFEQATMGILSLIPYQENRRNANHKGFLNFRPSYIQSILKYFIKKALLIFPVHPL